MRKNCLLALAFGFTFGSGARADVHLPPIISDHMVLQRSAATRIWGTADPQEEVTVTLGAQSVKGVAGADGNWIVSLNLQDASAGPVEMVVKGKNTLTISDVLVGEVWLASGQSNMAFKLKDSKEADQEIAQSANPQLRQFFVKNNAVQTVASQCEGKWIVADPATSGTFSAIGYYFIKSLNATLKVPVGLVHSSWGGTPVEAWTSSEALHSNPELADDAKRIFQNLADYPGKMAAYRKDFSDWLTQNSREDHPQAPEAFAGASVDLKDWVTVNLPGEITSTALPATGAIWIRREVTLPAASAGKQLPLSLGVIRGLESVYWNGRKIGEMTLPNLLGEGMLRFGKDGYIVPSDLVKEGVNTLAVRIFAPDKSPSLTGDPSKIVAGPVSLKGSWLAKVEYAFPPLAANRVPAAPRLPSVQEAPQHLPSALFNGMIAPILSYSIRGAIWYQGENNVPHAWQYRTSFPLMIADWRARWKQGDFPFYFCQLANYQKKKSTPEESAWAELRDAQSHTLKSPKTGAAILIDIGESGDIHPRNKHDAGDRLARIALAHDYGQAIPFSGPVYQEMKIENGKVRLKFTSTEGGLIARALPATYDVCSKTGETAPLVRNSPKSALEGFAICGEDQKWVWADAKIDGDTVLVWSDAIQAPKAVRYGWADNPTCNLYNGANLPASPFRTDDFAALTGTASH